MAETQPIVADAVADTGPSIAPTTEEKHELGPGSSATSDKAVMYTDGIPSEQVPSATREFVVPQPGSNKAIFSTDLCRRPAREPLGPPYEPVIVCSDKVRAVVDFALLWFNKYPRQYHVFFPNCGFTIEDLFDNADIHRHSPPFCREVLKFITQDNVHRATRFAREWSIKNRDRLHLIVADNYDPQDPYGIVDIIFVKGELKMFPKEFLWHAANLMRWSLFTTLQTHGEEATDPIAGVTISTPEGNADVIVSDYDVKIDREVVVKGKAAAEPKPPAAEPKPPAAEPKPPAAEPKPPTAEQKPAADEHKPSVASQKPQKKPRPVAPHSSDSREHSIHDGPSDHNKLTSISELGHSDFHQSQPIPAPATSQQQPPHLVPDIQLQPQRPEYDNQGPYIPMHGALDVPSPAMPSQQISFPKGRMPHRDSLPFDQRQQTRAWSENVMYPPGQQVRAHSGAMPSAVLSPRFPNQAPGGTPMMMHVPMVHAPHAGIGSPPMPSGHLAFPPAPYSMPQPHVESFGGPTMEMNQQNFIPGPSGFPGHQGRQIGDMTNTMQPYFNASGARMDQRGHMSRHASRSDQHPAALYNPYGQDRPDFANIPVQGSARRNPRNAFPNQPPRGRKFSLNTNNRFNNNQYGADNGDHFHGQAGGRYSDQAVVPFQPGYRRPQFDPKLVNDPDYGCGEFYIGPKNDWVKYLVVFGIPDGTPEYEVKDLFEGFVNESATVKTKLDKSSRSFWHVGFEHPAACARALGLHNTMLRGRQISVKVPIQFYDTSSGAPLHTIQNSTNAARLSLSGTQPARNSQAQQPTIKGSSETEVIKPTAYSPQDARSDLPVRPPSHPIASTGSPEPLQTKQRNSSTSSSPKKKSPKKKKQKDSNQLVSKSSKSGSPDLRAVDEIVPDEPAMVQNAGVKPKIEVLEEHDASVEVPSGGQSNEEKPTTATDVSLQPSEDLDTDAPKKTSSEEAGIIHDVEHDQGATRDTDPSNTKLDVIEATDIEKPLQPAVKEPLPPIVSTPNTSSEPQTSRAEIGDALDTIHDAPMTPTQQDDEAKDETVVSAAHVENVLDDEQKNETSFHSAKESQSSAFKVDSAEDSTLSTELGPGPINPAMANLTTETTRETSVVPFQEEELEKQAPAPKLSQDQTEELTKGPSQQSPPTQKKPGAAQTESLSIFAKSKAQAKKEKEAAKKAKKKAKGQKTVPAKSSEPNAVPPADETSRGSTHASDKSEPQSPQGQSPYQKDIIKDTTTFNNKGDKGKGKAKEEHREAADENIHETSGGNGALPPQASLIGVLAHEDSGSHVVKLKQDVDKIPMTAVGAPSSDNAVRILPSTVVSTDIASSARDGVGLGHGHGQQRKSDDISNKIAAPKHSLLTQKPKSPTTSKAQSINASSDKTLVSWENERQFYRQFEGISSPVIPRLVILNSTGSQNIASDGKNISPLQKDDTDSMASSVTLQPESPGIKSPSPTRGDFFTPAQTPSALTFTQAEQLKPVLETSPPLPEEQQSKKTKNKKNKKKKKAPAAVKNEPGDDAFSEQFNQIEGLLSPTKTSSPSVKQEKENDNSSQASQSTHRGIFDSLREYVGDKKKIVAVTTDNKGKKPVSLEEVEKNMGCSSETHSEEN